MHTVIFIDYFNQKNNRVPVRDVFHGSRYACYKYKNTQSFSGQYKVLREYNGYTDYARKYAK